jgi:holliday junction DNA helicase RuvA
MITYLQGKLAYKDPTHVIIDLHGVGYHVNISLQTYSQIKNEELCKLHTHFHVKEDSHTLFGFATMSERMLFLDLISVNGVGPSTGMMVLSSLSAEELRKAIAHEEVRVIQGVKGIGAKTAQRIILELKDKVRKTGDDEIGNVAAGGHNTLRSEALSALTTLGIAKSAAEKSIDIVLKNSGNTITLEGLIKLALKHA